MRPCDRGRRARGAACRPQGGGLPRGLLGRRARTGLALVLLALPLAASAQTLTERQILAAFYEATDVGGEAH